MVNVTTNSEDEVVRKPAEATAVGKDASQDSGEPSMMMYEDSFGQFKEGEVVTGVITSIDKDLVLVDIGYKSEGQIRINEFRGEDGNITAKIGDTIEVMVEWWDDEDERVILSKDKAANVKVWESIKKCHDDDGTITGTISSRVKGGFSVDIGVLAFLPGSQADLRPIRNLDEMVGKTFDFKILKYNRKRSNIVLSRRVLLEKERESKRSATLSSIHEGKVLIGTVKNITEYGVFVDLGGVDGLLHITDISWGRVKHPSKVVSVGESVEAVVLDIKPDARRISLGMKQAAPNPWDVIAEKYPVGTTIEGKIKNITDFGIFIGIDEGIDGLVHISDISWTKRIKHPSEIYKKGDTVQAIVLDIEKENERFSLGIKHLQEDPWKTVGQRYKVGSEINGTITNVTDFGIFVEIEEGIEGLVHVSEISKEKIKTPVGRYNIGDMLTARVMTINSDERRIGLSVKRLEMEGEQGLLSDYVNNLGSQKTTSFGELLRENLQEKLKEE